MENNYNTNQMNDNQEQEISLMDYLKIILNYRWLVTGIFFFVMVVTIIYTLNSPKIYEASSKVILEDKSPSQDFMLFSQGLSKTSINNTIEIIKSRPVVNLAYQLIQKYPDYDLFPIMKNQNEEFFDPINSIINNVKVETKRETDILTVSFESTSPSEAMIIVNSLSEALMQQNTQNARAEFTNIREFLESQLDAITRRLQNSEEDLRNYKIETGVFQLTQETVQMIEKASEANANLQAAQAEYEIAQINLDFLQKDLATQDTLLSDVSLTFSTPYIEQLQQEVVRTKSRITTLINNNEYSEDHPEIIKLNRTLDNSKAKLNEEIKKTLNIKTGSTDLLNYRNELIQRIAEAQVNENLSYAKVISYQNIVDSYDKKMSILPDTELELARLQRNYSIDEKIYSLLTEKYEDAKVAEQAKMGNIRIVERAVMPRIPIKPKKKMNLLIGFVIGIGLGVGAAMMINSTDTKIRTLDDVERFIKYPVVGTIPFMSINDTEETKEINMETGEELVSLNKNDSEGKKISSRLISHYAPKSPVAESYRTLRTNVMAKKQPGPLALIISSSGPSEGKSTSLANLAITLAQMKSKVIIVDFDLRRPMIHNIFELQRNNGSSDFLSEESFNINTIIKSSGIDNLDIITSGAIPPNPSELIASDRANIMITELKQKYDYVLFDMPPIIAVTDAMIMAKKVDMLLLVIRVNNTEKSVIQRTKSMLENININVTGIIVNGIVHERYYRGYSYYYYYYYYYYGESKNQNKKSLWAKLLRKN
ncbi:MAG: polysaccharide biosynthesis tyrosine autokinase [Candidatus Cloacimonetes bacterium]|nr:polysaccharide biosynthesis tyrosine autokinase [Candidatus Cloacimonadota bacterium]MDD4154968.1 polysaccharide biosynthesis tyrosine autokinase [Candidatus Cloacimonadota bacterium]